MSIIIDEATSLQQAGKSQKLDLSVKGQHGALRHPTTRISSSRYVKQRMIAVLVNEPALMRYLPDAQLRTGFLQSLIEDRAQSITGLNSTISVNFNEDPEGNSGEVRETPARTVYERSVPSYVWPETLGRGISDYWTDFIKMFIADPETGIPGVARLESYISDENAPPLIVENASFDVLFFEPNSDFTRVTDAILVTGMQPKSGGERTMQRTTGEDLESPTVDIEFTGQSERTQAVTQMAIDYLASLDKAMIDPDAIAETGRAISSNVEASGAPGFKGNGE